MESAGNDLVPINDEYAFPATQPVQSIQSSQSQYGVAGGQYWIAGNTFYNGQVFSLTDTQVYLYSVNTSGDYTAHLRLPSGAMDYFMGVAILNSSGQQVAAFESTYPTNIFNGHRIEVSVSANQIIAVVVASNDNAFVDEDYQVAVHSTNTTLIDNYEPNDSYANQLSVFSFDQNVVGKIDNLGDTDWYIFDWSDPGGYDHYFLLDTSGGFKAVLWKNVAGTLSYMGEFDAADGTVKLPEASGSTRYYIAIVSTNNSIGTYELKSARGLQFPEYVNIQILSTNTDYGSGFNYGLSSSIPMVRHWVTVRAKATDGYGNLLPNFLLGVAFSGDIIKDTSGDFYYTNAQGILEVTLSTNATKAALSSYKSPYYYLYDTATLAVFPGYEEVQGMTVEKDMYYFFGQRHEDDSSPLTW